MTDTASKEQQRIAARARQIDEPARYLFLKVCAILDEYENLLEMRPPTYFALLRTIINEATYRFQRLSRSINETKSPE